MQFIGFILYPKLRWFALRDDMERHLMPKLSVFGGFIIMFLFYSLIFSSFNLAIYTNEIVRPAAVILKYYCFVLFMFVDFVELNMLKINPTDQYAVEVDLPNLKAKNAAKSPNMQKQTIYTMKNKFVHCILPWIPILYLFAF